MWLFSTVPVALARETASMFFTCGAQVSFPITFLSSSMLLCTAVEAGVPACRPTSEVLTCVQGRVFFSPLLCHVAVLCG